MERESSGVRGVRGDFQSPASQSSKPRSELQERERPGAHGGVFLANCVYKRCPRGEEILKLRIKPAEKGPKNGEAGEKIHGNGRFLYAI